MSFHRIETHAHTRLVSPCGRLSPEELVDAYIEADYSGLIVTDHFVHSLPIFRRLRSWRDRAHAALSGFRAVQRAARGKPLAVYPGFELTFTELPGNDFLVYGIEETLLFEMPDICRISPIQFKQLADAAGALVFQAHPYRGSGPVDAALIDGVEVYNGNRRHDSGDEKAAAFADRHDLLTISGSDTHLHEDIGRGGICLPEQPRNIHELISWYRHAPSEIDLLIPGLTH
jgi:hypothetical protein